MHNAPSLQVVMQLMKGNMRSPLGLVLLIRYTQSLLASDASAANQKALTDFLEACEYLCLVPVFSGLLWALSVGRGPPPYSHHFVHRHR